MRDDKIWTHEGAEAVHINAEKQLRRSVMANMLWENTFYENGVDIAERIATNVSFVSHEKVADIAIEAREKMKLRKVPLLLTRVLAKNGYDKTGELLNRIIQRTDELTSFLELYWKDGRQPLSNQVKKGLAKAFTKFNEYQLAKYNRDSAVKLRDVLFLSHAKPKDAEQALLWKKLINGELATPDTWEVALSAGVDKKKAFERLINQNKLGALAYLRNLRNMQDAGIDIRLIREGLAKMKTERVLPFRFIAASRYAPQLETELEQKMFDCLEGHEKLTGKTILLVDVSGSMDTLLSMKSDLTCLDAACGLAMLTKEICESVDVYTFSHENKHVKPCRGFALTKAIDKSQPHGGTWLGKAVEYVNSMEYDRLIVITDEQSHDRVPDPKGRAYMINVASNRNGVGYGKWFHLDGFSEAIIDYIIEYEKMENEA
jgi:60 kDa SS-A/Ro ribonucleoprotein